MVPTSKEFTLVEEVRQALGVGGPLADALLRVFAAHAGSVNPARSGDPTNGGGEPGSGTPTEG